MPRITRVYTRGGDDGSTSLGSGERVGKDSIRIGLIGVIDEVNSAIGLALALEPAPRLVPELRKIQNELFHLGAALCVPERDKGRWPMPELDERHVDQLERLMDDLGERLEPLENFVLPGGTSAAAQLHVARAVCRRAERDLVSMARVEEVPKAAVRYLNRLSDTLFVLARFENREQGRGDVLWDSRA